MTEQYIGPNAGQVASLIPHRVSFDKGWFWTTTRICHGGESEGLAFRQRPDGNGIEVRCHTGGCTRGAIVTELEALIGLPIWTAYQSEAGAERKRWSKRRLGLAAGAVALLLAAPLALGVGIEAAALNAAGLGIVALVVRRLTSGGSGRRQPR